MPGRAPAIRQKSQQAGEVMNKYFFATCVVALLTVACGKPKSAWLVSPQEADKSYSENGGELQRELEPKAEILFVVDNSASMHKHISNVSESIDKFVESFSLNNPLKYNLAVTSVYDTRTFESDEYKKRWANSESLFSLGQFRFDRSQEAGKTFVSSADRDLAKQLQKNLKIGVQDLAQGGPHKEEIFSPVAAVFGISKYSLSPTVLEKQKNFYLGADAHKIIFMVTDATDVSDISASDLYFSLVAKAGGRRERVMAFAAMIPSNVTDCPRDPGRPNNKLEEFLSLTRQGSEGSNIVSLCDDFGKQFSAFGKSIRQRTLAKVIAIHHGVPVINQNPDETLRVFYGDQEIPFETRRDIVGFRYNPAENSVWLNPEFKYNVVEGAKICIQYTAVSADGLGSGLGEKHKCHVSP